MKKAKTGQTAPEAYSESDFLIRGIYSYKVVSAPPWAMQALLRCEGNSVKSTVEDKLPINSNSMSPKCWEAFIQLNGMLNKTTKLIRDILTSCYHRDR